MLTIKFFIFHVSYFISICQKIQIKQVVTSLESTAIELQAKNAQLEAQLELNVSLLLLI